MEHRLLVSDAPLPGRLRDQPVHAHRAAARPAAAAAEHEAIVAAHRRRAAASSTWPPPECPDMVFTANAPWCAATGPCWASAARTQGRDVVLPGMAGRPRLRRVEAPYPFSGQGDAWPAATCCSPATGSAPTGGCTPCSPELGYEVVPLRTVSPRWYDLDLAVAVIENPHTLAYCPRGPRRAEPPRACAASGWT